MSAVEFDGSELVLRSWQRVHITPDRDRAMAQEQGVLPATIRQHHADLERLGLLRHDEHGSWWLRRGAS